MDASSPKASWSKGLPMWNWSVLGRGGEEETCLPAVLSTPKHQTGPIEAAFFQIGHTRKFLPVFYTKSCKSISKSAQYVTPDSKIYLEQVKMCRLSTGNWFFNTKVAQLAVSGKMLNAVNSCAPPKKSVINWTWLRFSISDWSRWFAINSPLCIYCSSFSFIGGVYQNKKQLNLDISFHYPELHSEHWWICCDIHELGKGRREIEWTKEHTNNKKMKSKLSWTFLPRKRVQCPQKWEKAIKLLHYSKTDGHFTVIAWMMDLLWTQESPKSPPM
jgi:hypothetical protein